MCSSLPFTLTILRITEEGVRTIASTCPDLDVLDLTDCTQVNSIAGIEGCPKLALLDLAV